MGDPLKFVPFNSMINPGFWTALAKQKLDVIGLSESSVPITGSFTISDPPGGGLSPRLSVEWDAFEDSSQGKEATTSWNRIPIGGSVTIMNTVEAFKAVDKAAFLQQEGQRLWDNILQNCWEKNPDTLASFSILMFADLKKYQFYYWFAFPSFNLPSYLLVTNTSLLDQVLSKEEEVVLVKAIQENPLIYSLLVKDKEGEGLQMLPLSRLCSESLDSALICVMDPSSSPQHPGWPVRTLLAALLHSHTSLLQKGIRVICLRMVSKEGRITAAHSPVLSLQLQGDLPPPSMPSVVGWEKNAKGQLGPRHANMRSSMDPAKLAEASVDLNLKLMKWRLVPNLDLEKIKATKCLLLGAGTLGCGVARGLLGWGVRHITLVDNGRVSYSNPVRQSLFTFKDCLEGGRHKAEAAAERLADICPGVESAGHVLSIPMPGHPVSETTEPEVRAAFEKLRDLIASHNLVFLLMDSRESRWLPSLLAASMPDKLVVNAALGFDTFLVMRHGVRGKPEEVGEGLVPGQSLGCYFCNDVVAPGDSTSDRTLDQQCTVTRPGASGVAAALAVELAVSCLSHGKGPAAPAPARVGAGEDEESCLGTVPHTLRGSLHAFTQVAPTGPAFSQCTACSPPVLDALDHQGWELIKRVGEKPSHLEDLTGLTALMQDSSLMEGVIDLADDDCISFSSSCD